MGKKKDKEKDKKKRKDMTPEELEAAKSSSKKSSAESRGRTKEAKNRLAEGLNNPPKLTSSSGDDGDDDDSISIDISKLDLPPPPIDRSRDQDRLALRRKTRNYYDHQMMRIQAQGRITKKSPKNPIDLHPTDKERMQQRVDELLVVEARMLRDLEDHLLQVPFYTRVILPERKERFKGFGPRMSSVLISSFDIYREERPSQMWSFCGLAPIPAVRCKWCYNLVQAKDGVEGTYYHPKPLPPKPRFDDEGKELAPEKPRPPCRFEEKDIQKPDAIDSGKAMHPEKNQKLPYNAWLRTKMVGVFADVLIKGKSWYTSFYYNYKHRLANSNPPRGCSDGHRDRMAKRYMIKMMLLDIWREWRKFEGLPVPPSYQEQYLGHTHHATPEKKAEPTGLTSRELYDLEVQEVLKDAEA